MGLPLERMSGARTSGGTREARLSWASVGIPVGEFDAAGCCDSLAGWGGMFCPAFLIVVVGV